MIWVKWSILAAAQQSCPVRQQQDEYIHTHGWCRHIAVVCIFGEQNLGLLLLKEAQMAQWVCEWEIKKRRERERSGCEWQIFPSPFSTTANIASSNTMILSSSSGKSFFSFFLSLFLSLSPCLFLSLWASREQNSFSPTAVLQPQSYWRAKVFVWVCMSVCHQLCHYPSFSLSSSLSFFSSPIASELWPWITLEAFLDEYPLHDSPCL